MEIQNLHLCNTFFTPINVIRIPFLFYQKKIHFYYQPTSIAILYYLYYRSIIRACRFIFYKCFTLKSSLEGEKAFSSLFPPPNFIRKLYKREVRAKR